MYARPISASKLVSTALSKAPRLLLIAALVAAFLLQTPSPAHGQSLCMGRDALLTQLYLHALEQPVAIGLTAAGNVVEVLASGDGATWTLITTGPTGLSCVVQTGEHWQAIEPAADPATQQGPDL